MLAMSVNPLLRMFGIDVRPWHFRFEKNGTFANRLTSFYGKIRTSYAWQRAVAQWGRAFNWAGRDNFVILSAARSGTTLLVDYLNCHPRVRCRGEILNSDYACYGDPRSLGPERLRLQVESFFVARPGKLAGAKLLTYQLDELPIKLADVVEVLDNPKIIVLYREHTLDQFVSLKTAERDRVWHSKRPIENEPISLDPGVFIEFAKRERRMWRENLAVLSGRRVHYLTYEQLTRQTKNKLRGVFDYLGLEACDVHSPLVKLNGAPLRQRLASHRDFLDPEVLDYAWLRMPAQETRPAARAA